MSRDEMAVGTRVIVGAVGEGVEDEVVVEAEVEVEDAEGGEEGVDLGIEDPQITKSVGLRGIMEGTVSRRRTTSFIAHHSD